MKSLYQQFEKEFNQGKIELIIVDNSSNDGSVQAIEEEIKSKKYNGVVLITNKINTGFGAGCNKGAQIAKGSYLLFLNNDTVVRDKSILKMADFLNNNPDAAILGGQLKNTDGTLQESAGKFYTLGNAFLLLYTSRTFGNRETNPAKISPVDWVKGALFMVRHDVFDTLSGFDEKIFMYGEDMELCYRAHLLKYKVYFYPDTNITHIEHGSANRSFAIVNIYKNLLYFYKKHRPYSEYITLKVLLQTKAVILLIFGNITKNTYLVQTYSSALREI